MRIKITNNKNQDLPNAIVKKVVEFYLEKLAGLDKFKSEVGELKITFKNLIDCRGGYLRSCRHNKDYLIIVNSKNSLKQQLSTLAHECVHLKQYVLGELSQKLEFNRGRACNVKIWKGREYRRKAYLKRPWEIEARKYQDKLSYNVLNKINKPIVIAEPVEVVPVLNTTREIIISILNGGSIPNGDLVPRVLNGETDKQKILKVLREVFALKQSGIIQEYSEGSLIYVRECIE